MGNTTGRIVTAIGGGVAIFVGTKFLRSALTDSSLIRLALSLFAYWHAVECFSISISPELPEHAFQEGFVFPEEDIENSEEEQQQNPDDETHNQQGAVGGLPQEILEDLQHLNYADFLQHLNYADFFQNLNYADFLQQHHPPLPDNGHALNGEINSVPHQQIPALQHPGLLAEVPVAQQVPAPQNPGIDGHHPNGVNGANVVNANILQQFPVLVQQMLLPLNIQNPPIVLNQHAHGANELYFIAPAQHFPGHNLFYLIQPNPPPNFVLQQNAPPAQNFAPQQNDPPGQNFAPENFQQPANEDSSSESSEDPDIDFDDDPEESLE